MQIHKQVELERSQKVGNLIQLFMHPTYRRCMWCGFFFQANKFRLSGQSVSPWKQPWSPNTPTAKAKLEMQSEFCSSTSSSPSTAGVLMCRCMSTVRRFSRLSFARKKLVFPSVDCSSLPFVSSFYSPTLQFLPSALGKQQ
jgi:hypothetical protein